LARCGGRTRGPAWQARAARPEQDARPGPDTAGTPRGTYAVWVSEVSSPGGEAGQRRTGDHSDSRSATATLADTPEVDVTRLRVAIARLSRRLRKHELAGLTPTQLAALATVERTGSVRLGDLAAAERIAPSTLTRLVSVLEEHGYVQRCAVPGDARAWTLVVTTPGHEVLERIRQENTIQLADSLRTLSAEQVAALAAALPALEKLADSARPDATATGQAGQTGR
jgi:DNA-binding MarR family transcriptional regulator